MRRPRPRTLGIEVEQSIWVCTDDAGEVIPSFTHGDPPVPAAYVTCMSSRIDGGDDDDRTWSMDGTVRTADFFLNASRFCNDHGHDFFTWFVRQETSLLLMSMASERSSLAWLLNGVATVTTGPSRSRGVWVPEEVARALADWVGSDAAEDIDLFYSQLHRSPVFSAHLKCRAATAGEEETAARPPPA